MGHFLLLLTMIFFSPGLWGTKREMKKKPNKSLVNWTRLFCFFSFVYFLALAQITTRHSHHERKKKLNCDFIYITSEYLIGFRWHFFVSLSASSLRHDKLENSIMQWQGKADKWTVMIFIKSFGFDICGILILLICNIVNARRSIHKWGEI